MKDKVPMTKEGFENLRKELQHLKSVVRPKLIEEIQAARELGDITDNAEFRAAKEKQSHVQTRIIQLENKLARAQVIDTSTIKSDRVAFGAMVVLEDTNSGETKKYILVGEDESDLNQGKISIMSPIARALIGHKVGDIVKVKTPGGINEYEILELSFK